MYFKKIIRIYGIRCVPTLIYLITRKVYLLSKVSFTLIYKLTFRVIIAIIF